MSDLGSNNSGYYTLQAVLTHRGRSSSSGHYVGWIRQSDDNWIKCDDDTVSPVTNEEILKLSGGGKHLLSLEKCVLHHQIGSYWNYRQLQFYSCTDRDSYFNKLLKYWVNLYTPDLIHVTFNLFLHLFYIVLHHVA